jgi:transcriptional regulator with XRE-family HTH domain
MNELTFGQRIVALRTGKQLLQKELAEKAGISPTALNYYEKDKREPNVMTIKKIANALGISGDELLGINNAADYYTQAEKRVMSAFRSLNKEGQEKVIGYMDDLLDSGKYIKNYSYGVAEKNERA